MENAAEEAEQFKINIILSPVCTGKMKIWVVGFGSFFFSVLLNFMEVCKYVLIHSTDFVLIKSKSWTPWHHSSQAFLSGHWGVGFVRSNTTTLPIFYLASLHFTNSLLNVSINTTLVMVYLSFRLFDQGYFIHIWGDLGWFTTFFQTLIRMLNPLLLIYSEMLCV